VAQQIDIAICTGPWPRRCYHPPIPGKVELIHVKREIKSAYTGNGDPYESTVLARDIGTRGITNLAGIGRHDRFFIEQDPTRVKLAGCAKEDLAVMKAWATSYLNRNF